MTLPIFRTAQLIAPAQPRLPAAPVEYNQRYADDLTNILRLYFNQLQNFNQPFTTNTGGGLLQFPSASYQSNQTQSAASTTVAYPVTFDVVDFENAISIESGSNMRVSIAGAYNIQFSFQFENSDAAALHDVDIWLGRNGSNVDGSNGHVTVPVKHAGVNGAVIAGWNYVLNLAAEDYVTLYWRASDTAVTMPYVGPQTSPARPATASAIVTISFVSAIYP